MNTTSINRIKRFISKGRLRANRLDKKKERFRKTGVDRVWDAFINKTHVYFY